MEGELLDWELVHGSDTESTDSITSTNKKSASSSVIDDDGMILLSDHFSADSLIEIPGATTDPSQYGGMESGDPFRVDYGSESPNRRQNPVDSSFDQLNDCQSGDAYVRNELGFYDSKSGISGDCEVRVSDFEADDEKHVESEAVAELTSGTLSHYESNDLEVDNGSQSGVEEPIEDSSKSWSGSGGNELVFGDSGIVNGEEEIVSGSRVASTEEIQGNGGNAVQVGDVNGRQSDVEEPIEDSSKFLFDSGGSELVSGDSEAVNGEEEIVSDSGVVSPEAVEGSGGNTVDGLSKSGETVWWKMPLVLVKYYAFRIGPVWSVSMAAAVMGLVLLGRRLYNMKKKAQRFQLKVTIDHKKASRVMSQAARLNEVFTEVRRVPVIRPSLPSPGAWPVLSLR